MEPLVNNFIKAAGWSIFHSLWQGAAIYMLLFTLTQAFPRISAKIKHNMAYASVCGIFLFFCITFFSIFQVPVTNAPLAHSPANFPASNYTYLHAFPVSLSAKVEQFFPVLVILYILGIVLQMIFVSSGYLKLKQLKNAAKITVPENWQLLFYTIKKELQLKKDIGFFLSEQVNVPLVLGYFKPIVLFPVAFVAQLEMNHVEAILIHELSHIRRNDYLLNLIKTAIETVLFFNPFVWMCTKLIHIEREHACDDLVVKRTGTPLTYAHALLQLELIKQKSTPVFSMAASGNDQHLYQRIKRITNMKTTYTNLKQQTFVICLTIATIASLAWINPSKPVVNAQKNKTVKATNTFISSSAPIAAGPDLVQIPSDTTKKKKVKIITVDKNGVKQEYHSVEELPDSLKTASEKDMLSLSSDSINLIITPLVKGVVTNVQVMMNSPEWKKQMENIQLISIDMARQLRSADLKKQMEALQQQSIAMAKTISSQDFKKTQEALVKSTKELQKHLNSAEIKRQAEIAGALYNSAEYKELQSKFNKEVEQLRKKKEQEASEKN